MDRQKTYDVTKAHLLQQGLRALRPAGCAYRAPDGTRCAVGVHIPDALYHPEMEGHSVRTLCDPCGQVHWDSTAVRRLLGVSESYDTALQDYRFLTALQQVHDKTIPEYWGAGLEKVALEYGLVP